jgi:hypothetical protein
MPTGNIICRSAIAIWPDYGCQIIWVDELSASPTASEIQRLIGKVCGI